MKKLLFVSSGLVTSNTSAAIRNRRLVSELRNYFDVYAIDVAPQGSQALYGIAGVHAVILSSGAYAARDIGVYGKDNIPAKARRWVKHFIRCVVPDKYSIELLFYDFSSVLPGLGRADIVLTSSDPKGIHACLFNKSFCNRFMGNATKIVEYWGDPWYGDINFYTNGLTRFLEQKVFRRAHHVIFNSVATYREKMMQCGGGNFHFLSRGVEGDLRHLPDALTHQFEKINILYAGDYFAISRNIGPLVGAVGRLDDSLLVVGDGDKVDSAAANITFLPRVDFETAQGMTKDADMLVVLLNRVGGQIPGKLYDYASTTHPVVILYEDERLLSNIPFPGRFIFVRNNESDIYEFLKNTRNVEVNFRTVKKAGFADEVRGFLESTGLIDANLPPVFRELSQA